MLKIYIGHDGTLVDRTQYYSRSTGALSISDSFSEHTRSATCNFTLVDIPVVPKNHQLVEIRREKEIIVDEEPTIIEEVIFSGVVKSVTRVLTAMHTEKANLGVFQIVCGSWEIDGSAGRLITFKTYYGKTAGHIVKSICEQYLPHLTPATGLENVGPVMEAAEFVMKSAAEAITSVCQTCGFYWWVTPDRVVHLNQIADEVNVSPITLTDATEETKKIGLQLAQNIEDEVNDLYLVCKSMKGAPVTDVLEADGFTGNYRLTKSPYGMNELMPIVDEFSSNTDVEVAPDPQIWNVLSTVDEQTQIYIQAGRLQTRWGSNTTALMSHMAMPTETPFEARNLEIEFPDALPIGANSWYAFGLCDADEMISQFDGDPLQPDIDGIVLGVKIDAGGELYLIKNGVATTMNKYIQLGVGYAYQIRLNYYGDKQRFEITLQGGGEEAQFGKLGSSAYTILHSELEKESNPWITQSYLTYCPVMVKNNVLMTVMQGAVLLRPPFFCEITETGFISNTNVSGGYMDCLCDNVNWSRWNLKNMQLRILDEDGEIDTGHSPYTIYSHTDTTLVLDNRGIDLVGKRFQIAPRMARVGATINSDYHIHCFVEEIEKTPHLRFFQGEIPSGTVRCKYWSDDAKAIRIYDSGHVTFLEENSGIAGDDGFRKLYITSLDDISELEDLVRYGKTLLGNYLAYFAQGQFQTDTGILGEYKHVFAGMSQPVSITIGDELFEATSFISSVTISDEGGHQFSYNISLGGLKQFIHNLFMAKIRELYKKGLVISEKMADLAKQVWDDAIDVSDEKPRIGKPTIIEAVFNGTGLKITWERSPGATHTEVRMNTNYGTAGYLYRGTAQTFTILKSAITQRRYTLFLYDYDSQTQPPSAAKQTQGLYGTMPAIVTLENRQPVPKHFKNIQIDPDGRITVEFFSPQSADVLKRVLYINNEYTPTANLVSSDKILELSPQSQSVTPVMVYDSKMYLTLVELDPYSELDRFPLRVDTTLNTGIVCRPPKVPTVTIYDDRSNLPQLSENEIRVEIDFEPSEVFGNPEHFHIEFDTRSNNWQDPLEPLVDAGNTWAGGGAIVREAGANKILITDLVELNSNAVGKLLTLITSFDDEEDPPNTHPSYQSRYITAVTTVDGGVEVSVGGRGTSGGFFVDKGTYSWAVWDTWYEHANSGVELLQANMDAYSVLTRKYIFTLSRGEFVGYARVFAVNKYGLTGWTDEIYITTSAPTYEIDKAPAPLVDSFDVSVEGFTLASNNDRCQVIFTWDDPDPILNFDHVAIFADSPIESKGGGQSGGGGESGGGEHMYRVGEFWDSGMPYITIADEREINMYCVSVNADGWYPPNWYNTGEDQLGGYRCKKIRLVHNDNIPTAPANLQLEPTFNGLWATWDKNIEFDVRWYKIDIRMSEDNFDAGSAWGDVPSLPSQSVAATAYHLPMDPADSGKYMQVRVQALDGTTDNINENYSRSDVVRWVSGSTEIVYPCAQPTDLDVVKLTRTIEGVLLVDLAIDWDLTVALADPKFGGVEVWVRWGADELTNPIEPVRVGRYAEIPRPKDETAITLLGETGQSVRVGIIGYNKHGIVYDYADMIWSPLITLDAQHTGVPKADVSFTDGVDHVNAVIDITPITSHPGYYAAAEIYISETDNSANSKFVMNHLIAPDFGQQDRVYARVDYDLVESLINVGKITGFSLNYGQLYYFFVRMRSKDGVRSAWSTPISGKNHSAVFIHPQGVVDAGAPSFATGAIVAHWQRSGDMIQVYWNQPTVHGTSVWQTEIQIATSTAFEAGLTTLVSETVELATGTKTFVLPNSADNLYGRLRYRNRATDGVAVSSWYGDRQNNTYVLMATSMAATIDTERVPASAIIIGTNLSKDPSSDDAFLPVKFTAGSTYDNSVWNINVTVASSSALLADEFMPDTNGSTGIAISSLANDLWVSTGAVTPSAEWVNCIMRKVISEDVYEAVIIEEVSIARKQIRGNHSLGAYTGNVQIVKPLWKKAHGSEKSKIYNLNNLNDPTKPTFLTAGTDYYCTDLPFNPGATFYARVQADNAFGPGQRTGIVTRTIQNTGQTAYNKTAAFRTDGAPTNLPPAPYVSELTPSGFQFNGSVDHKVEWGAYTQGAIRADYLLVFYRQGTANPTLNDPCIAVNVNVATAHQLFTGLNPSYPYRYGIAAARTSADGVHITSIVNASNSLTTRPPVYGGNVLNGGAYEVSMSYVADGSAHSFAYLNTDPPDGFSFNDPGGSAERTSNGSFTMPLTVNVKQNTHAQYTGKHIEAVAVFYKEETTAISYNTPAVRSFVVQLNHAQVTHNDGQNIIISIEGLDAFAAYSFAMYGARQLQEGVTVNTSIVRRWSNIKAIPGQDLILKANSSTGYVRVEQPGTGTALTALASTGLIYPDGSAGTSVGVFLRPVGQSAYVDAVTGGFGNLRIFSRYGPTEGNYLTSQSYTNPNPHTDGGYGTIGVRPLNIEATKLRFGTTRVNDKLSSVALDLDNSNGLLKTAQLVLDTATKTTVKSPELFVTNQAESTGLSIKFDAVDATYGAGSGPVLRSTGNSGYSQIFIGSPLYTIGQIYTTHNIHSKGRIRCDAEFEYQGLVGATGATNIVTAIQWTGTALQYKTRSMTISGGIVTALGAESGWITIYEA